MDEIMCEQKTAPRRANDRGHDPRSMALSTTKPNEKPGCSIAGCIRPVLARGWCGAHYAKWRRYGDPIGTYKIHGNKGKRYLVPAPINEELKRATPEEIAWAAGLFEGEGSVYMDRSATNKAGALRAYASPRMKLNSTDKDVIERMQEVCGGRVIFESQEARRIKTGRPRKDQWCWVLQGYESVVFAYELMKPWLKERRRARFEEVFAECNEIRSEWEHYG